MYDRIINDTELSFGVSGKLYESNVLLYDHQTESLWSQLQEQAVTGALTGTQLVALPAVTTTWKAWREKYPQTLVLSTQTGFRRDYSHTPYQSYAMNPNPMFPVQHADFRLKPKDKILGVSINGQHKAYPFTALQKLEAPLEDQIGDTKIQVAYDPAAQSAQVTEAESGKLLPSVVAYWFAWATFHRSAAVYGNPTATIPQGRAFGLPAGRMSEGSH